MVYNSWVDLESACPISIGRLKKYSDEFNSLIPEKVAIDNLNNSKERVLQSRSALDSMIICLTQVLYDRTILREAEDKVLYFWLCDNLGRFLRKLDEKEDILVIKFDEPDPSKSSVGISRISAYVKLLRTAADSLVYETLLKATDEYHELKENETWKKEPRTFLYILFQIVSMTLNVLGGLTREDQRGFKKGMATTMPLSWQSLMTPVGKELIKEGYEEQTGRKIDAETMKQLKNLEEEASLLEGEKPTEESEEEPEEEEIEEEEHE